MIKYKSRHFIPIGNGKYKVTAENESSKPRIVIRVSSRLKWKENHIGALL
jgi:hypothetical protein